MTAGAPWSVKGIDPKAREIAKDLARRSGMTLGEWLNQMIMEDPAEDAPEAASAGSSYHRFEAPEHPGDDVLRTAEALERLTARIEAAEQRTTQAIGGVDQSVSDVLARLAVAEREQTAVSARFEGAVDELRTDTARVGERLRRVEQEEAGARSAEAVRAMEAALAKVASHLYDGEARTEQRLESFSRELEQLAARPATGGGGGGAQVAEQVLGKLSERLEDAEGRTSEAIRGLEASFAQLDARLGNAETHIDSRAGDGGLEQLAASLSARVDAARAEMAEKIREAADGRFERIERTLTEMTGHVQAAENRSAQAIERMGHEVLRMADTLGRRVQDVEQRSSDAIEQVGGEVARMASAMETRLTHTDVASAQALEKLGGEIARITERLTERIAGAERRSAQAIDDIGDQMARVSDRLQDRQEKVSTELAERIRQSEERTAKLLEEGRERIDQRLGETQRRLTEAAPPVPPRYEAEPFADPDVGPFGAADRYEAPPKDFAPPDSPYSSGVFDDPPLPAGRLGGEPQADFAAFEAEDLLEPATFVDKAEEAAAPEFRAFEEPQGRAAMAPSPHILDEDEADLDIEAADPDDDLAHDQIAFDRPADPDVLEGEHLDRVLSTRELIEQARAAARAASQPSAEAKTGKKPKGGAESSSGLFSGFGLGAPKKPRPKRRGGSTLATALIISGGAAAVGVALAGYELVVEKPVGALPSRVAEALGRNTLPAHAEQPAPGEPGRQMAAVALTTPTPKPTLDGAGTLAPAPPASPAASEAAAELYADAVRRIDARDFSGMVSLRKSANLGYPPAEFYLGKLYETGGAGMTKDLVQARQWTERAAEAGDKKAMHNLALYYFEGSGGPKDLTQAAEWFRRAAQLGLVDSQFNLAQLYQEGIGVARNPAEAYKWYLIAARQGDGQSRTAAQALKGQLTPEAQATAERAADGFQSETSMQMAGQAAAPSAANPLVTAQRALSRLGYYQGPYDGHSSPALSLAIAAYQRDQGLPSTGTLDATVNGKLAVIAQ
jgi:localization factor PodJL